VITAPRIPAGWTEANIADQSGRRFLITGATSGLGLAAARALVAKGADVTITARNEKKAAQAIGVIGKPVPAIYMDLSDLTSVRKAAAEVNALPKFDVVALNAGVMVPPFSRTADGFELQMGTNHLGHFAFAGLIRDCIIERLVSQASQAHRMGSFGDGTVEDIRAVCMCEGKYSAWGQYGASKLANLLFSAQVERLRLQNKWSFIPLTAHPGWTNTSLFRTGGAASLPTRYIAQKVEMGVLPLLAAMTFPGLIGNSYIGPNGIGEMRGTPRLTRPRSLALDPIIAANLWTVSEELTGVSWENSRHA
jgi:NAD(P)-dependent dehydrogenase (short-subunit alcohol dehydrogenase family)